MDIQTKETDAGEMSIQHMGGHTIYTIETYTGHYRGGYAYDVLKHCILVSGRCELITSSDSIHDTIVDMPLGTVIQIPAHIPNLFRFLADSVLLEWFDTSAQKTEFERYRQMKK